VEEAVKEEDRECKKVGLTWRARRRERAKGRGPTQRREGVVEEAVKEEDREWRCKRADNEATPCQSTDMEAYKGKSQTSREQSKRRGSTERRQRAEQKRSRRERKERSMTIEPFATSLKAVWSTHQGLTHAYLTPSAKIAFL